MAKKEIIYMFYMKKKGKGHAYIKSWVDSAPSI